MNIEELKNSLEAILFASGEPVSINKLAENFNIKNGEIVKILNNLKDRYINTSLELINIKDSYQLVTKAKYGEIVKAAIQKNQSSALSQAALEVLAIIAYNGAVSKSFIEQARGVDSASVVHNLMNRGLVKEAGRLDLPGKPIAYTTTLNFLRSFSLSNLSDLPAIKSDL